MKLRASLLLLSSGKKIQISTLVLFCIFTGIIRGILEGLFFDASALKPALILSYVPFYTIMFLTILMILKYAGGLSEANIYRVPLAALFLGIFPPLIDLIHRGGMDQNIRYGYYLELFFPQKIPNGLFFYYMPEYRVPLGETIIIWATILLTAFYARMRRSTWFRTGFVLVSVYLLFFIHSCLIPSVLRLWISSNSQNLYGYDLNLVIPLMQMFLSLISYLILRKISLIYILKRLLHIGPFLLIYGVGAVNFPLHSILWASFTILLFFIFFTLIVQNDFYDLAEDARQNRKRHFIHADLIFFTAMMTFALILLSAYNLTLSLFLFIILLCGILYSFPFYRGKGKIFPTMKFEGIWGAMSFLAGAIPLSPTKVQSEILIQLLLVFLGWSFFALLKDVKDIRADYKAGQSSIYIAFYRRKKKLRDVHRLLMTAYTFALLIVPAFYALQGRIFASMSLLFFVIVFAIIAFYVKLRIKVQGLLAAINGYLLILLLITLKIF